MGTNLRTLGVRGENLPEKKTQSVVASDFQIGGLLINTERKFDKTFKVSKPEEFQEIFGDHVVSTDYGGDAAKGFFDNILGVDATLIVQSVMGYDVATDALDEVTAFREKADVGADADALTLEDAYQNELGYGVSGNRTGTKITTVDRFATQAAATCAATAVSFATLDSVVGIYVGDLILFETGALGVDKVYKIVTAVDEDTKQVSWAGDFESAPAAGETLSIDDDVVIPGFRLQTYRKSIKGIVVEVDVELGKKICSTESAVIDFFVDNIFESSKWLKSTYLSASTLDGRLFTDDTIVTYLTSGAAGTAIATTEALDYFLSKFDNDPIRFLAYPESTSQIYQDELVLYSLGRDDTPIVIINIAEDRTKSQLEQIGQGYQKSDFRPGVIAANWLEVEDVFSNSLIAPFRTCPNVGHVMGAWIYTIGTYGIHYIPATTAIILKGIQGVKGDQFHNDRDRTDIAERGVNLIQEISGVGIKIANCFTISTNNAYLFGNIILMRNFIKLSSEDSLQDSDNTPNSLNRISEDKMAILTFMYELWFKGSTKRVPEGETFGQGFTPNNEPTVPTDHFEVIADISNNPQVKIDIGERNVNVYFTGPTPAGSIIVGVGILMR